MSGPSATSPSFVLNRNTQRQPGIHTLKPILPFCQGGAVQRRVARFCFNDYRQTSSVSSMMEDLGWEQLQTRCQQNKTVMMYHIVNNLVEIPANQYLTPTGVSTRGHQKRFRLYYCSVNAYKGSFFPSAIRLWNALPANTVSAQSIDDFKVLICADIPRL